ncbi:MAG: hypothetical protein RR228_04145 [Bacilli bacterium]
MYNRNSLLFEKALNKIMYDKNMISLQVYNNVLYIIDKLYE